MIDAATQAKIDQLEALLNSGATTIKIPGEELTLSLKEVRMRIRELRAKSAGGKGRRTRYQTDLTHL